MSNNENINNVLWIIKIVYLNFMLDFMFYECRTCINDEGVANECT